MSTDKQEPGRQQQDSAQDPQQTSATDMPPEADRPARYEVVPQRGGAKIRVRYREGSQSGDCRLCK